MDFLFRRKPGAPATIPTDRIIPMYFFDDNYVNRAWVMHFTMRFDDVLDPGRLQSSLARLMELGDWRKLGARVRQNVGQKRCIQQP